jgi:hypothetical protein
VGPSLYPEDATPVVVLGGLRAFTYARGLGEVLGTWSYEASRPAPGPSLFDRLWRILDGFYKSASKDPAEWVFTLGFLERDASGEVLSGHYLEHCQLRTCGGQYAADAADVVEILAGTHFGVREITPSR